MDSIVVMFKEVNRKYNKKINVFIKTIMATKIINNLRYVHRPPYINILY